MEYLGFAAIVNNVAQMPSVNYFFPQAVTAVASKNM